MLGYVPADGLRGARLLDYHFWDGLLGCRPCCIIYLHRRPELIRLLGCILGRGDLAMDAWDLNRKRVWCILIDVWVAWYTVIKVGLRIPRKPRSILICIVLNLILRDDSSRELRPVFHRIYLLGLRSDSDGFFWRDVLPGWFKLSRLALSSLL